MSLKMYILNIVCFSIAGLLSAQPQPIDVYPGENTISEAMMWAYPGDILLLSGGEYTETQTMVTSIDITIRGVEGAKVVWFVPGAVGDAIHVKSNLRLENIIFKTDSARHCIVNMYGSVTPGDEANADKNSIYVDGCQFHHFGQEYTSGNWGRVIWTPDPGDSWAVDKEYTHPLDTLFVTNSLFYGGHTGRIPDPWPKDKYGNPMPTVDHGTYQGIRIEYNCVRMAKIQNCTFWLNSSADCKIYGFENDISYMTLLVDHCTFYDGANGAYFSWCNEDDTVRNCIGYKCRSFAIKGTESSGYVVEYNCADSVGFGCDVCQPYHYDLELGNYNLIQNPMFKDPDNGDFTLMPGSPCIGAAKDGSDMGNPNVKWDIKTAVEEAEHMPCSFKLKQNYPNPFNPLTTIFYSVAKHSLVTLDIYSITGQKVRSLVNKTQGSGSYSVVWNGLDDMGNSLSGGVYFYRLRSGSTLETKKMLLLK